MLISNVYTDVRVLKFRLSTIIGCLIVFLLQLYNTGRFTLLYTEITTDTDLCTFISPGF